MMISIIIPAYNEEHFIDLCLYSLQQQRFKDDEINDGIKYEVMVVCNGCTDNTQKIAKRYTKHVYSLKEPNVCKARNYGAQKAQGDILLFLDADCLVAENLLEKVNDAIREGYVGGTTKTIPIEKIKKAQAMMWLGNTLCNHIFLTAKGIMFCRKDSFPGFNETMNIAEDTYFLLALKKKGNVKYITDSYVKTSMRRFEKKGYIRTIFTVCKGFFIKGWHCYEAVR